TLGPAQVGAHDDDGTGVGESVDRRYRRLDAAIVGDRLPVQRDVEVGPDEYPLAAEVSVLEQLGECSQRNTGPAQIAADPLDDVDQPVRVAPLVVVPADHLDLVADGLGQARVEDARRRVGDDVAADDGVFGGRGGP